MLAFCDEPYRYFPPRYNPLIAWLLKRYNARRHLPRTLQISGVETWGGDELRRTLKPGDRVVILPNHPTHADAPILLEALRQVPGPVPGVGLRSHVMAAYDVFLRSRLDAWVMQRLGAFSVDRDGSGGGADNRAMKQALSVLERGRFALTIFPEGHVYLQNDQVTPFNEGAAFIALKAARQLAGGGSHEDPGATGRVLVVPVSIKVTHTSDVRPTLTRIIREMAQSVDCPIVSGATPLTALKQIGLVALARNLQHRGFDCPDVADRELPAFIEATAGLVIARLESKLGIEAKPSDGLVDRIRRTRRLIHEVRTDENRAVDHAAAATWADEAMVAFKIASYSGRYVTQSPTLDRVSETTEKLYEDLYHQVMPPIGPRHAYVKFNPPIDLTPHVDSGGKLRVAVREVTAQAEGAVQDGLYQINAGNQHCGVALWNESIG